MIQISNANTAQSIYLKLEGYSDTSTAVPLMAIFTNQLTGKLTYFLPITPTSTNGRYQELRITPPAGTDKMVEGLYLVSVSDLALSTTYATRLAFVRGLIPFGESTYTPYTTGDTSAYSVYTK